MNLLRGKHITLKDEKDFRRICNSLESFTGEIQLFGKVLGEFYQSELLVEKGKIIASSFENLEKGDLYLGDDALTEIKGKFISKSQGGRLELYELGEQDMKGIMRENLQMKLASTVSLKDIDLKLTPYQPRQVRQSKNFSLKFASPGKSREEKTRGEMNSMELIKRSIEGGVKEEKLIGKIIPPQVIPRIFQGMKKFSSQEELKKKKELLRRLSKKKGLIDKEIAERISKLLSEKKLKDEKARKGGKIRTSIDELYEAVKKGKSMKLNNALAKRFGVNKTQLESWAMILEEHNLVELHYPAIGEPEIRRR